MAGLFRGIRNVAIGVAGATTVAVIGGPMMAFSATRGVLHRVIKGGAPPPFWLPAIQKMATGVMNNPALAAQIQMAMARTAAGAMASTIGRVQQSQQDLHNAACCEVLLNLEVRQKLFGGEVPSIDDPHAQNEELVQSRQAPGQMHLEKVTISEISSKSYQGIMKVFARVNPSNPLEVILQRCEVTKGSKRVILNVDELVQATA
jgi:hypothetical protein